MLRFPCNGGIQIRAPINQFLTGNTENQVQVDVVETGFPYPIESSPNPIGRMVSSQSLQDTRLKTLRSQGNSGDASIAQDAKFRRRGFRWRQFHRPLPKAIAANLTDKGAQAGKILFLQGARGATTHEDGIDLT